MDNATTVCGQPWRGAARSCLLRRAAGAGAPGSRKPVPTARRRRYRTRPCSDTSAMVGHSHGPVCRRRQLCNWNLCAMATAPSVFNYRTGLRLLAWAIKSFMSWSCFCWNRRLVNYLRTVTWAGPITRLESSKRPSSTWILIIKVLHKFYGIGSAIKFHDNYCICILYVHLLIYLSVHDFDIGNLAVFRFTTLKCSPGTASP